MYEMIISVVEKPMLEVVMQHADGNQSRAAEWLGINRNTLRRKLLEHKLIEVNPMSSKQLTALISVSDKTGILDFAQRARRPGRQAPVHRRHRQAARREGPGRHRSGRAHRLSRRCSMAA